MDQYGSYARDPGAAAGSGVAPLGQQVQFNVIEWWPYGFHPSTKVLETTSECSSILSRIARAAANVRRAEAPEDFGKLRDVQGIQKGVELEFERFTLGNGRLFEADLAVAAHAEDGEILAGVVERQVLVGLEEAEFADALGGDAAGGEVGHAAVGELQADVGDIHLAGEDGDAGGADFLGLGAGERQDEVHVVDHEIEHDVDIQAARAEQVHAVDFEEEGQGGALFEGQDGGVKALQVAHLQDAAVAGGGLDQAVGGGKVAGDGLFDQDVDAGVEKVAADFGVDGGGRGDDGGVDLAGEVAGVGEGDGLVAGGGFVGAGGIGIDDGGELRARRIRGPRGSGSVRRLRRR